MFKSLTVSVCFVFLFIFESFAANYYIDATKGSDSNPGTSPSKAWKSIGKVNSSKFAPGDSVLFKRGEVWHKQLTIPSSGTKARYITYGAYGNGKKPVIDLQGRGGLGIFAKDKKFWVVRDFEVCYVARGNGDFDGSGIRTKGSTDGFVISHNHVHHVENMGIGGGAGTDQNALGIVEFNEVHDVCNDGIAMRGGWGNSYGRIIRYNHIYKMLKNSIDILGSVGAVVEGNLFHHSRKSGTPLAGVPNTSECAEPGQQGGIKAGGNYKYGVPENHGGRNNKIIRNIAYNSDAGWANRGAIGNIYRNNFVFRNYVNFVISKTWDQTKDKSLSKAIGNVVIGDDAFSDFSRTYDVLMEWPELLKKNGAVIDSNQWLGGAMVSNFSKTDDGYVYGPHYTEKGGTVQGKSTKDATAYRKYMAPMEQNTTFKYKESEPLALITPYWAAGLAKDITWDSKKDSLFNKWTIKLNGKSYDLIVVKFGSPQDTIPVLTKETVLVDMAVSKSFRALANGNGIQFLLPSAMGGLVNLTVHNLLGQPVWTHQAKSGTSVHWEAPRQNGLYFVTLKYGKDTRINRIVVAR